MKKLLLLATLILISCGDDNDYNITIIQPSPTPKPARCQEIRLKHKLIIRCRGE